MLFVKKFKHGQTMCLDSTREAKEWGIFNQFSGQEKVCNVDQIVWQARIPTESKLVTFCI